MVEVRIYSWKIVLKHPYLAMHFGYCIQDDVGGGYWYGMAVPGYESEGIASLINYNIPTKEIVKILREWRQISGD